MNKFIVTCLAAILLTATAEAQENKAKLLQGFDGGMMLHTGYLRGNIEPINHFASGMPFGIGGVIRVHLGEHWRVGSEGYVSNLSQLHNGSYIKYGWGGVLGDFHWTFGRFLPYAGLTIGGGTMTDLLMVKEPAEEWSLIDEGYYRKKGFLAIDPFIGCDFIVSDAFHLTLKADWLSGVGKELYMPTGPRLYVGFIFFH